MTWISFLKSKSVGILPEAHLRGFYEVWSSSACLYSSPFLSLTLTLSLTTNQALALALALGSGPWLPRQILALSAQVSHTRGVPMKALLLTEYKSMSYTDVPSPVCGPEEVLIQVKACGICGSDIHGYDGSTGRRIPPLVMGHEAAGVITGVGAQVTTLKPGSTCTMRAGTVTNSAKAPWRR
jgi:hypothetical protein